MPETEYIKAGFVPSLRREFTDWCKKIRNDSLAALAQVKGLKVLTPQSAPGGESLSAENGYTPTGAVSSLDEAVAIAEYFRRQHVDALIICPLDFGDESSAVKIGEILNVPVLLYAFKEPPVPDDPSMLRVSDSYCGNLTIAAAFYRRKITYHYAGLFFPDEAEFKAEIQDFVRAVAVVKGLRGARIGQLGLGPVTFGTFPCHIKAGTKSNFSRILSEASRCISAMPC